MEPQPIADFPFTLDQLQALKAVEFTGSYTGAASYLHLSPSTVRSQIYRLELDLNLKLFLRQGRSIQMTREGQLLATYATLILQRCQAVSDVFKQQDKIRKGTLFLGASSVPGTYLVPMLLGQLRANTVDLTVQVQTRTVQEVCLDTLQGRVDVAIIEGQPIMDGQAALQVIAAISDELVLVVSPHNPLAQQPAIRFEDLQQLDFLALDSQIQPDQPMHQALLKSGIDVQSLNIHMQLNCLETLKNLVQANLGVAFVPRIAIAKELELALLHPLPIRDRVIPYILSLIATVDSDSSPVTQAFIQDIQPHFPLLEHRPGPPVRD